MSDLKATPGRPHWSLRPLSDGDVEQIKALWSDEPMSDQIRHITNLLFARMDSDKHGISDVVAALNPVADALRASNVTPEYLADDSWNPDAHTDSITITIAEARAIFAALAKSRGGQ